MDVGLVCDNCHAFNPMGASGCSRCGAAIALDPPRSRVQAAAAPAVMPAPSTGHPCPACSVVVAPGHRFCHNCGAKMPDGDGAFAASLEETQFRASPLAAGGDDAGKSRSTAYFGAMQVTRARLTLIRGDGLDGVTFTLAGDEHYAGRVDCPLLFPDDPYLAPVHANFFYRDGSLVVRDEQTVNGIYLRISGAVPLPLGTRFLVGEQVLQLDGAPVISDDAEPDGTYYYASPRRPAALRVTQLLRGGSPAWWSTARPTPRSSAAKATTSTSPTTPSSRGVTPRCSSPRTGPRSPTSGHATAPSCASPASRSCATATTSSWGSSCCASRLSDSGRSLRSLRRTHDRL
jgi:hypothetical protein